jgi:glycosyltransferase involved in cell wall biosynthesis
MGGAEYQAHLLIERLVSLNLFDIHYIARNVEENWQPEGYTVHRIARRQRFGGAFFPDAVALWKILREVDPDVIYQRVGCAYTGIAAHYASLTGARLIWHVALDRDVTPHRWRWTRRAPLVAIDRWLLEYGLRNAHAIVVQTREQARLLCANYGRSPVAVIGNFHPGHASTIEKPASPVRVCWIANMKAAKRPDVFLRLARELGDLGNVEFVMAGRMLPDHRAAADLRAQIAHLRNLRYLGEQPVEEVNALLARSHVVVNTSACEGLSNVFIQAWLREVPVISLDVNPDGALDGERHGFCADGSYPALRDYVRRVVLDGELRRAMGVQARAFAEESFGMGNVDRLVRVLDPRWVRPGSVDHAHATASQPRITST